MIFESLSLNLPRSFLEDYKQIESTFRSIIRNRPEVILSDIGWFHSDELFRFWVAKRAELGTRLIALQHGGNYGSLLFHKYEEHEKKISDHFLSWGWSDGEKIIPAMIQRVIPIKRRITNDAPILYISTFLFKYGGITLYSTSEYLNYQFRFVAALPREIQERLLVRRYFSDYGYNIKLRWGKIFPNVKTEQAGQSPSFFSRLRNCRMVIIDNCNTTMFQSLALNIPTLLFWDSSREIIRQDSLRYYDHLNKVGILHYTPESAANHLMAHWDNLETWWWSKKVQLARKEFSQQFCRTVNKPHNVLIKIVKDIL